MLVLVLLLLAAAVWLVWSRRRDETPAAASAEPEIRRAVAVPEPEPEPEVEPEPDPLPGAAAPLADGSPPGPEYTIKGNAGSGLFHLPSSPYYARTKPEMWFRTAEDARAAGFTEWRPKRRATG
ncbi:hypothetical protein BJF78_05485 [Pseudonocardia sp. CNS-139]|nr:hypothetical protein BJF78_05485 [Pseudonocardia sp. CNS-139]